MEKHLHIKFNAPLNKLDTEMQTFGCRQNNPDICSANRLEGVCAFVTADNICYRPSRAWKKQYAKLNTSTASED